MYNEVIIQNLPNSNPPIAATHDAVYMIDGGDARFSEARIERP